MIVSSSNKNRLIEQADISSYDFDCNIQQIKAAYFDFLYYVLFFKDVIEIFKIGKKSILEDQNIKYSNKQHRGNIGEGQFHINNGNYLYHKGKYFINKMSYKELKEKLLAHKK